MSENLEKVKNAKELETAAAPEESVEFVSQEAFENADKSAAGGKKAKKAKKPLSKNAKIGITAGVTVLVVVLGIVIGLVIWLFTASSPSGPVDNGKLTMIANKIGVATGAEVNLSESFEGATDFVVPADKATISDKKVGETTQKVMKVTATTGEFSLTFNTKDGDKVVAHTVPVKLNKGVNVSTEDEFRAAFASKKSIINVVANLVSTTTGGYAVSSVEVNGNGFTFDATTIAAEVYVNDAGETVGVYSKNDKNSDVFDIAAKSTVVFSDFHIIGERIAKDAVDLSLDEFEYNGTIFSVYGDGTDRPNFTMDHCITENGQKHMFINSADVTIKDSLLRNGADAIIAIETDEKSGAVLTTEDTIISNSVVAGILFCGWDASNAAGTCTLNIKGYLDIYNWKDTKTTKLCPATEKGIANIVNNLVGLQMNSLLKDPEAVEKYMAVIEGKHYVHLGIILLATGSLQENKTQIEGINIETGKDDIGFVKRGFPIPDAAKAIAKTCELIGYNGTTAKEKTSVQPNTGYGNSANFKALGMTVVDLAVAK